MAEHIVFAAQVAGKSRTETLMGRAFRVFPAVLVKSKVLSNNLGRTLLEAEDISPRWAEAWNGAPVLVDHPQQRGAPVGARDPDVLNSQGVGHVFRARAENGALTGEVFLDTTRADDVGGLADVLAKLEAGETVELSTGFPVAIENRAGTHDGEAFDAVIHPIGADHLAVFADKIGACSVTDGCGLAANHEGACDCGGDTEDVPAPPESVTPEAAAAAPAWQRLIATAARMLGFRPAEHQSDEDRRRLLSSAVREAFGGEDRFVFVDSVFSDEDVVVFEVEIEGEGDGAGLFRADFTIDDSDGSVTLGEPARVRRVTTFEPVENEAGEPRERETVMDREQMIAHLAEAGREREALGALSDADLQTLVNAEAGGAGDGPPEGGGEGGAWERAQHWRRKYERLDAETRNAREAEKNERTELLDDLLYNAADLPWTEKEIRNMELPQLRKVYKLAFPARTDYSGRGGPRASNTGPSMDFVKPIMSGPRGEAVLDREEVA